ncbi:MAG: AAA family ATPase, partial [Treponemataceae bacterium]|nr:AAA family ATPase [Treponemataceae bacterium]
MHIVRAEADLSEDEDAAEFHGVNLRPQFLAEFIGQESVKQNLAVFIDAAKRRQEALDHLFLIGPPGLGKTTLAQIAAHELGTEFKITSAPA